MPGGKLVRRVVEPDLDAGDRAPLFQIGPGTPVEVQEVHHPVRDPGGRPVGREVDEAGGNLAVEHGNGDVELQSGSAEQLERPGQRIAVEDERALVILALIGGELVPGAVGAPLARGETRVGRRADRASHDVGRSREARAREVKQQRGDRRTRPGGLRDPAPGPQLVPRARRLALLQPGGQHRLVHDPRVHSPEPVVEPARDVVEEVDPRPRDGYVRIGVRPGADQALARPGERREEA